MRPLLVAVVLLVLSAASHADDLVKRPAVPQKPKSVVYFFDASATMKPLMPAIRHQLKGSIGAMAADQQVNLVPLKAGKLSPFSPQLVAADPDQKTKIYDWIDSTVAEGQPSLAKLADYLKTSDAEVCYVLISDDVKDVDTVLTRLQKEYKGKTFVNVILLTADAKSPASKAAQRLAEKYGGILRIIEKDKI